MTECIVAISASVALVTVLAVFLVNRIEDVVVAGVPDQFLGLILLPLVEKAAEHLTAIDEAWDGQMVGYQTTTVSSWHLCTDVIHSELRAIPLPWAFNPDCPVQCSIGGSCWLGYRKTYGSQFRDFYDCPTGASYQRGWKFPP